MLEPQGNGGLPGSSQTIDLNEISTLFTELKSELQSVRESAGTAVDSAAFDSLQETVKEVQESLRRPSSKSRGSVSGVVNIGSLTRALEGVSSVAVELCRALLEGGRHLTREQLIELQDTPLGTAISELRAIDVLVPLRSTNETLSESDRVVYWFPSGVARPLETALSLVGRSGAKSAMMVRKYLRSVGYKIDTPSPGKEGGSVAADKS